jgi:hypothetical protein
VDGAIVDTWQSTTPAGNTTFTRSGSNANYVANSGGGIPAIDFTRSAPFLGDFSAANGAATIGDATILVWANFDGYTHTAPSSSYYYSIDGAGNEHTLGRDGNSPRPDYIYSFDGAAEVTGVPTSTNQPQPAGWKLYIARFYGTSLVGTRSMEAWIDSVGDGAVVANSPDLVNEDSTAYNGNANALRVGAWTNAGSGLDGQIRGFRVYNTILSNTEVREAAQAMTGVPEPSTIGLAVWLGTGGCLVTRKKRRQ